MGPIVRLVGSGIGFASEALSAHKENKQRSRSPAPSAQPSDNANTQPPAYDSLVEVANDHEARQLIDQGRAVPVNAPHQQNVMYLMIVNMPSEEELATAKREMEWEKKQEKGEAPSEQA